MKYNELTIGTSKKGRRVGRGIAAGQGKTAGRGTKGQKSRTGNGRRPGFEGGQNPLMQRLPKLPGFTSKRVKAEIIYTGMLNNLGQDIDNVALAKSKLITSPYAKVKLVVKGDLDKKITLKLQGASAAAIAQIQKKGGTFNKVPQLMRSKKEK